jgi:tetratricopeptide (TPR) repeat protein
MPFALIDPAARRGTLVVCVALVLGACAVTPAQHVPVPQPVPTEVEAAPAPVADAPAPEPDYPRQLLTNELLFGFLVGDIAAQRGERDLAAETWLELSRRTGDPRVAQRATELGIASGRLESALTGALLWRQADSASMAARQTLLGLLLRAKRLPEAEAELVSLFARNSAQAPVLFLQLEGLWRNDFDAKAVQALTERLAAHYPGLPEAQIAIAQARQRAGDSTGALAAVDAALALRPRWSAAVLYRVALLRETDPEAALAAIKAAVRDDPESMPLRAALAQEYNHRKDFAAAEQTYAELGRQAPESVEYALGEGLAALQGRRYAAAERAFRRAQTLKPADPDAVAYFLGLALEDQWRLDAARQQFAEVNAGDYRVPAKSRLARIAARQGDQAVALAALAALPDQEPKEQLARIQTEAQVWRELKALDRALATLDDGIRRFPDELELRYDRGLLFDVMGRFDDAERDLRVYLEKHPDSATALNALGYTLANRTGRLAEAEALIRRALEAEPDSPVILDSLGWVLFRQGKVDDALVWLKRAFDALPDPEIAAHYGEALWTAGRRKEALAAWASGRRLDPSHEVLNETLKRLVQ